MSDTDQTATAHPTPGADAPVKRDLLLSASLLGVVGLTFLLTSLVAHL